MWMQTRFNQQSRKKGNKPGADWEMETTYDEAQQKAEEGKKDRMRLWIVKTKCFIERF